MISGGGGAEGLQFHLILFEECRLSDGVGNLGIETVSDPVLGGGGGGGHLGFAPVSDPVFAPPPPPAP